MPEFDLVRQALADPARTANDQARDALRSPLRMLRFAEVAPGQRVLDIVAGDFYWTNLFRHVLCAPASLWSMNPTEWDTFMAPYVRRALSHPAPLQNPQGHAQICSAPYERPAAGIPSGSLDIAFTYANYHDLADMRVDRHAMNTNLFEALAPGGIYVVIDHAAAPGTGLRHAGSNRGLHRIDETLVRHEIEQAGFELVDEADWLRDPADAHTSLAWVMNGRQPRTDRFALKFRKPG